MNFFSIRDIENLTGIKAHTLRIWEQRHRLFIPKRKESNHRIYDNEDLKYILRIAFLYNNGYKISHIAKLTEEEISRLALQIKPGVNNDAIFSNQLTEAALDFDHLRFEGVFNAMVFHNGLPDSILTIIFPLLKKMGQLWLAGEAMPAQEHFASAIVIKKLLKAIETQNSPAPPSSRKVMLFTPQGELHEIPLLFMQYMLKKHGITVVYPGNNCSLEVIKTICEQQDQLHPTQPVTELYFHLVTNLIRYDLGDYLTKIATLFPQKGIYLSGPRNTIVIGRMPRNVTVLTTSEELMHFASSRSMSSIAMQKG